MNPKITDHQEERTHRGQPRTGAEQVRNHRLEVVWNAGLVSSVQQALERHQVALYLAAIAAGVLVGVIWTGAAGLAVAVEPVIALLLFVTFLAVPVRRVLESARDWRFLLTLLAVNWLVVPPVVWLVTRPLGEVPALLVGACLVLLAPCVDYVVVFTRIAGGAHRQLLAATPLLMLAQMLATPVLLPLIVGEAGAGVVQAEPFLRAFLLLVLAPFAAAALVQVLGDRWVRLRRGADVAEGAMVPLMMLTLLLVAASSVPSVMGLGPQIALAAVAYLAFAVLMTMAGWATARLTRLPAEQGRAVLLSGVTRNSLVVLPLALAVPTAGPIAGAAVVLQTVVELVVLVALVRILPRML